MFNGTNLILNSEEDMFHVHFQTIRIYHKCVWGGGGRIEKSVPMITDLHHEACRVMTNGDPDGRIFYPTLTRIKDFFLVTIRYHILFL